MNISENIKKLCSNINYIFDKDKNVKYTGKFKPVLYRHIYSSSKNETLRIEPFVFLISLHTFSENTN